MYNKYGVVVSKGEEVKYSDDTRGEEIDSTEPDNLSYDSTTVAAIKSTAAVIDNSNSDVATNIKTEIDTFKFSTDDISNNVAKAGTENNTTDFSFTPSQISVAGLEPILSSPRKASQKHISDTSHNDKPVPRLVIEKLVLTNFKSYAGTQVVGPFHHSFSAVVGPNGSGKSNVIDSMLFVFGFRASKMRQSKLKELIHNSENFPDLSFCQVDIHFKKVLDNYDASGQNTIQILENSELIVSRKAFKNNSSTYFINHSQSSYTEVTNMLKNEGIDLDHKRFLILQGEVEMIAQMKPKAENENDDGLLEYLEDIIGTSSYKEEIENTSTEIENLVDNFNEQERRFKYTTTEFESLETQKDLALKFLKLEKQLNDMTRKYWYLNKFYLGTKLKTESNNLVELKDKFKDFQDLIEKAQKKLQDLKRKKKQTISQRNDMDQNLTNDKKKLRNLEKDHVALNEKFKTQERKRENLNKSLQSDMKSLKSLETDLDGLNSTIVETKETLDNLYENLKTENEKLDEIKSKLSIKTKKYSNEIEDLQQKLEPWKNSIDQKESEINIKNSEIDIIKSKLGHISAETIDLKQSLQLKSEKIESNKLTIKELKHLKSTTENDLNSSSGRFKDAGRAIQVTKSELNEIRNKIDYAKSSASNFESQNKVLSALRRLQASGRISGFYGKLGDLGVIPDKYDIAVSTGGGALSDFVVETVEDAQNCIQYLRQNNLGFAKFIVLQKLRKFNLNKINTPSNVPRLFDLIEVSDPKFAPAFYSSMYDTLVATDLNQARKVAFNGPKRWRVVTLDGKLVDVSGTMSGGGNRVSKGAMRLESSNRSSTNSNFVSPAELQSLNDQYNRKDNQLRELESAYRQIEQILRNAQDNIPKWSNDILKYEMENSSLQDEIEYAQRRLKELEMNKNQTKNLEARIKQESAVIDKLKSEKATLVENSKELQNKIDELQNKILDIGGLTLKTQTGKVESLKDSLQIKNEKLKSDELKVTKLSSQIVKLNGNIKLNEMELKESEKISTKIKSEYDIIAGDIQQLTAEVQGLESQRDELSNQISELDDSIDSEDNLIRQQNETIGESGKKIQKIQQEITNYKLELEHAEKCLQNIEFRDVTEYISWLDHDDPLREQLVQEDLDSMENLSEAELKDIDIRDSGDQVDYMRSELSKMSVNLDILLTYGEKKLVYDTQKKALDEASEKLKTIKMKSEELNELRHNEFKIGFQEISKTLKEMYSLITAGGNAELEYYDSHDAFSEGIIFSVMPPRKSWRTISNLSGGEKTLASLALVFALHQYKPTPLYVMDEIDAALDFKNVSIVANYIKSRTKNAQFIVISLRNNMFELAERLVGIYKVHNMTKSATIVNKNLIDTNEDINRR